MFRGFISKMREGGGGGKRIFRIIPPPALGCPHKKKLKIKGEGKTLFDPQYKRETTTGSPCRICTGLFFPSFYSGKSRFLFFLRKWQLTESSWGAFTFISERIVKGKAKEGGGYGKTLLGNKKKYSSAQLSFCEPILRKIPFTPVIVLEIFSFLNNISPRYNKLHFLPVFCVLVHKPLQLFLFLPCFLIIILLPLHFLHFFHSFLLPFSSPLFSPSSSAVTK